MSGAADRIGAAEAGKDAAEAQSIKLEKELAKANALWKKDTATLRESEIELARLRFDREEERQSSDARDRGLGVDIQELKRSNYSTYVHIW